jgi:exopolysaccharide production protein ExoZ
LTTIGNLQLLRGIAALGVVFYHTDFRLAGGYQTDFFGVSTFFVISGFIMCFITRTDAAHFLERRIIRIVPLYWLLTASVAVFYFNLADNGWWALSSLFFLPSDHLPMLAVGWTLNLEIYFYIIFALALWLNRRLAPLITAAVILAVFAADQVWPGTFPLRIYAHIYVLNFVVGILVYYLWSGLMDFVPRKIAIVTGAAVIAFCYLTQFDNPLWGNLLWWWPAWPYFLAPLVVAGALLMNRAGADIQWRPLIVFGDASYSLYLSHRLTMHVLALTPLAALGPANTHVLPMLLTLAVCLVAGIAMHFIVERPLGRLVRNAWAGWKQSGQQAALEQSRVKG